MFDFLHEYFVLHALLNAAYVGIGIVGGRFLAWVTRVERRYVVRPPFILILVLVAVLLSLLITTLTADSRHILLGIVLGVGAGFGTAFWSRRHAKAPAPRSQQAPRAPRANR